MWLVQFTEGFGIPLPSPGLHKINHTGPSIQNCTEFDKKKIQIHTKPQFNSPPPRPSCLLFHVLELSKLKFNSLLSSSSISHPKFTKKPSPCVRMPNPDPST
ncbi:hypothetical protein VNO77_04999 [Canavalia gladiata]|uniref:Uncharacterized protein n=1 Tax=Canavalia gladiata TaxID=3824 RepID=A0AAN9N381_CANGL